MTQTRVISAIFSRTSLLAIAFFMAGAGTGSTTASAQAPSPPAAQPPAPASAAPPKPAAPAPGTASEVPPTSAAPPPSPEQRAAAETSLAQGEAAYKAGDYAAAVAHFQQANALVPSPIAQYWLATSLDLQGNPTSAIAAFEALFADPTHTTLPPEQLEPARTRLSVLKQLPATVALEVQPADVELLVDGIPQPGTSPFSVKIAPGTHKIRLQREGYEPLETELTVGPAEALADSIQLQPLPQAAPPPTAAPIAVAPPPPAEPRSNIPAYVTLGVAGAGAVVGTLFGIQALSAKDTFDSEPTASHADDVERNALIADMAFGVAFTLGITGVVLLTTDEPPETARAEPKPSLAVAPYATPSGAGAAARLAF